MSQDKPDCNTKKSGKNSNYQCYRWQFTLKSLGEPDEPETLCTLLRNFCKEWTFQLEEGEKDGYRHYQGCFSLINKEYLNTVKNMVGRHDIHLENKIVNWNALKLYCSKQETRIEGPWTEKSVFIKVISVLYKWQQEVLDILIKEPDNRFIYWFWDDVGNIGKTAFVKYMAVKHGATAFNNAGTADLAYALPDNPRIVLFNLVRSTENRCNYAALEQIKDGLIFSAKYKSGMKIFNSPHVVVFANYPPHIGEMSFDRWKIKQIWRDIKGSL